MKHRTQKLQKKSGVGWLGRSIPAATAAATPSAMAAAVAGTIAASITATATAAVAALPRDVPLPAMPVPSMLCIESASVAHPCLLIKEPVTASAAGAADALRAAIPSFLPCLAPRGRVAPSAGIAACSIGAAASAVAAAAAIALCAAGGAPLAPVAIAPCALPSGRMRSRLHSFFRTRCYLL